MLFTNNQKQMIAQVPVPHSSSSAFSSRYMRSHAPVNPSPVLRTPTSNNATINRTVSNKPDIKKNPSSSKMKWGEPTWTMFHTIAAKIKPEYYSQFRGELLNIIQMVSTTLPCPICAAHASEYTKRVTEAQIATQYDLQKFLWAFHNSVNQRKGQPFFPFEQLHETYYNKNTRDVLHKFIDVHSDKHTSFRMISDDFYRIKIIKFLKTWFINNITAFHD